MRRQKISQAGFHIVEFVIIVLVVSFVGFVGYKVFAGGKDKNDNAPQTPQTAENEKSNEPVKWAFNEKDLKWFAQTGAAPTCKEPFVFDQTPSDVYAATVVGMPGSYRGYSYKPHGGIRYDNSKDGHIDVRMPTDATLVGLKRYYEGSPSTLQYLATFETDCGIAFRFDHLYTLTPAFQAIADTTPEPKKDDTSSDPNIPFTRTAFKSGDLVATAIGFPATKNFGYDFGVYDYRQRNEISKNTAWSAIHSQYQALEWYGVCWTDMFAPAEAAKIKQLTLTVINPAKPNIISDYCSYAPHRTLEFNSGQPTDG